MTEDQVLVRIKKYPGDLMRLSLLIFLLSGSLLSCSILKISDSNSKTRSPGAVEPTMKYSKISGTFLNFQNGQRIDTGTSYSSQQFDSAQKELVIRTYVNNKVIETHLILKEPRFLEFTSQSNDPRIPVITGEFFSNDYEDCILKSALPDKKVDINGVVTKIDLKHAVSTKTLTDSSSGKTTGIMQEQVELISEAEFRAAVNLK